MSLTKVFCNYFYNERRAIGSYLVESSFNVISDRPLPVGDAVNI